MNRVGAALLASLATGCATSVDVHGRTFGTVVPVRAGMALVNSERELDEPGSEVWPLSQVKCEALGGISSDEQGFFSGRCRSTDFLVTPVRTRLSFSREGYRPEERTFWLTGMDRGLIVILLKEAETPASE